MGPVNLSSRSRPRHSYLPRHLTRRRVPIGTIRHLSQRANNIVICTHARRTTTTLSGLMNSRAAFYGICLTIIRKYPSRGRNMLRSLLCRSIQGGGSCPIGGRHGNIQLTELRCQILRAIGARRNAFGLLTIHLRANHARRVQMRFTDHHVPLTNSDHCKKLHSITVKL